MPTVDHVLENWGKTYSVGS